MQMPTMVVHGRFSRHLRSAASPETPFEGIFGDTRTKLERGHSTWISKCGFDLPGENARRAKSSIPPGRERACRALSFQCEEHHAGLTRAEREKSLVLNTPLPTTMEAGSFGENVFVRSGSYGVVSSASTLCVGDLLAVVGSKKRKRRSGVRRTVVLEISSPRRPCWKVDGAFGKTPGSTGVRSLCAKTGLAGFLCTVVEEGELDDGDHLGVIERPHPRWSLSRVSSLLYGMPGAADTPAYKIPGEGTKMTKGTGGGCAAVRSAWTGTESELRALATLPQLAGYEWRDEFVSLATAWDGGESRRCVVA